MYSKEVFRKEITEEDKKIPWGQCVTVADISSVINEQEKPGGKALGTFIDKTAPWAQNYRELNLTSFVGDYPVIRDASLNSINNKNVLAVQKISL